MNMIYNGMFAGMMPKLKSDNFQNMELIRPLYLIKEEDIIAWTNYNELNFIDCACLITKKDIGKRKEIKNLIKDLKNNYIDADKNIFNTISNVKLDKIIKYYKDKAPYDFLDKY